MDSTSQSRLEAKPTLLNKILVLSGVKAAGVLMILIGLVTSLVALDRKRTEKAQYTWYTVSAQVTDSRREKSPGKSDECYFEYEYLAAGQVVRGTIYSLRDWKPCEGVDQYEIGDTLNVYYSSENPTDSVVVRENVSILTLYPMYLISLMTVGVGAYAMFIMSHTKVHEVWHHARQSARQSNRNS